MKIIRTPEARFERLANYRFKPNYLNIDSLRIHYVDEGNQDADPVLMMHGEPTWSYLYRHMIPICVAAGHRVIAPDLVGFGKSDKPTNQGDYSYQSHIDWMLSFIEQLDLKNITLVCQDWGSLIGLRLAAENEQRFKAIVVGNGMLPTGEIPASKAFKLWKAFAQYSPWFPIGKIVNSGSFKALSKDEKAAYDSPFPSEKYKAATRAFPKLVPVTEDNPASDANRKAWKILKQWKKPFLTTFSNGDPIMRGGDKYMQDRIPGTKEMPHQTLVGGHFLQEDSPTEFAEAINSFLANEVYDYYRQNQS
ncbi:MAG: haloalkane dehalogenase [Kangiellaceae bacterium]|nr:haloalkane dehalogenase [Kangiellaceae bacterium]